MDAAEKELLAALDFEESKVCEASQAAGAVECSGTATFLVEHRCCGFTWLCCDEHAVTVTKTLLKSLMLGCGLRCGNCRELVDGPHPHKLGRA